MKQDMNTRDVHIDRWKNETSELRNCNPRVSIEYGYRMATVWLESVFVRKERTFGPSLTNSQSVGHGLHFLRYAAVLILMFLGVGEAWGQADYSGTYYIGSVGYVAANTTTNYYLCPTEGWAFFVSDDTNPGTVTGTDNKKPFLTTYRCRSAAYHSGDSKDAVWYIEKAPNSNYYYIKHANSGRYLVSNGAICANPDRARVHLETISNPNDLGDKVLFDIYLYNNSYIVIRPIGIKDNTNPHDNHVNHKWLTINQGNFNQLNGNNKRTDGPSGFPNTGGIVCLYTENDGNGKFYLESAAVAKPVITNNFDGTFTISAEEGATIYYTTDGTTPTTSTTTTGTSSVNVIRTENMTVIKAIAKKASDAFPSVVTTYTIPQCARPVITVSGGTVTITCATAGATIHYTTDGSPATSSSATYTNPFPKGEITSIRAIATKAGYIQSGEAALLPPTEVSSSNQITNMSGNYILSSSFVLSESIGTSDNPFMGTIDGKMVTRTFGYPLVAYAEDAIIKNVILDNVTIGENGNGNAGAICCEARGETRIYNCGVLATNSTPKTDANGYTSLANFSSTVSGSNYVGSIVGLLDGSSRVINCFSYANVEGGDFVGGIVGWNNVATTSENQKTMVMNCMFYGEVSGTSVAPIYNGETITNRSAGNGVSNFNYFRQEADFVRSLNVTKDKYNCALAAETRFLQRFEFFRPLLNSNRALAAWWATGNRDDKDEMMKWVMEPSQIGTSMPYPILKEDGRYHSVINIDNLDVDNAKSRSIGTKKGTLTVYIQKGSGNALLNPTQPSGAGITVSELTLDITDKDPEHFNFNYYKVQLPYYNDVGTGNYTENRVVTGWKIVGMSKTAGSFTTGSDASAVVDANDSITLTTPYNFADRNSTVKDIYSNTNKRVFNQGAYFDVPEGVTSITIEPYWGKCVYVADEYFDAVYNDKMDIRAYVTNVGGGKHFPDNSFTKDNSTQAVDTTMTEALSSLNPSGTVYDNAIVLVGNVHSLSLSSTDKNKPYTIMSVDLNHDNEPDYSYILRFDNRVSVHPVRVDFLNVIGLGMAQKSSGGKGTYNLGIMQPQDWFEVTNTGLFRVTQFEYDVKGRNSNPLILQGGVIEQWVTVGRQEQTVKAANAITYYHVGGNVWFKEFHIGVHQDKIQDEFVSKHPPISVTGGDFDEFYLTGLYNTPNNNYKDNAECYINGGRFGKVAGTGMQGLGTVGGADNTGNIIWQIDNADIDEFYAGGINAAHKAEGNIWTVIKNSRVDQFCGGPKFGDMNNNKKVVTNATNCTFRTFFGAGYGGNSYNRRYPSNFFDAYNYDWNGWVNTEYTKKYDSNYSGIEARIDYQFIPKSDNTLNVARLFVDYVSFSLATTHDVTSKLTGCTITTGPLGRLNLFSQCVGNFYGGGSLGKVAGPVKSTLTNCKVEGNVFGAGYSATLPSVGVMANRFQTEPNYDENLGAYLEAELPSKTDYTWEHGNSISIDTINHVLYTTEDLSTLGAVTGNVSLTIDGNTVLTEGKVMSVDGCVYGGGEESAVGGNTNVNLKAGTVSGSIYGGGKLGTVGTYTTSTVNGSKEYTWAANTGKCTVTIAGGIVGPDTPTEALPGNVFGGGKGDAKESGADAFMCEAAMVDTTQVFINNGTVNGTVYGGGEIGRVNHNTEVTVGLASGTSTPVVKGNVFGAGKGLSTHGYSALVRGNSKVTIQGDAKVRQSVYGGGEIASVGKYSLNASGRPVSLANQNSGYCTVIIQGNAEIGPAESMKMITESGFPDDAGHVFGGGMGVLPYEKVVGDPWRMQPNNTKQWFVGTGGEHTYVPGTNDDSDYKKAYLDYIETLGLATQTYVTIGGNAFVKGSVYGGSMNGHVQHDTNVTIAGGQIGCGKNTTARHPNTVWGENYTGTEDLECASWEYKAPYTTYDIYDLAGGKPKPATNGHTFYGNVFGGGSGYYPYSQNPEYCDSLKALGYGDGLWHREAGSVGGNTVVNITGGHILSNVYGGNEQTDVVGSCTVNMNGGTVGVPRTEAQMKAHPITCYVFGGGKGDQRINFNTWTNVASTRVNISGDAHIYGSTYGGGENGHVLGNAETNIGGSFTMTIDGVETTVPASNNVLIGTKNSTLDGNVFGGGQGSVSALTAGVVGGNVNLSIQGGHMLGSVYGGGQIASVGTHFANADDENYGKMQEGTGHGCLTVDLTGGTIEQNVYGGCMGANADESRGVTEEFAAKLGVSKTVAVNLNQGLAENEKGCAIKKDVFGCNNVNGSPQQAVTVHVYATQNADKTQIANTAASGETPAVTDAKREGVYDVRAVYGGGNLAAYKPVGPDPSETSDDGQNTTYSTNVIIDGCGLTSIQTVYGGGNAASTPATSVTVNGTSEIEEVFGGGNGKDAIGKDAQGHDIPNPGANVGFYDYSAVESTYPTKEDRLETAFTSKYVYGTGAASVNIFGGTIHRVFGGSNTKGNVRQSAITMLEDAESCRFCVDEAYGGGKSAPMDAEAKLLMSCIPGLKEVYGGAEAADVYDDVSLTITNGTFDRVFGGNNLSGTIRGSITVTIEETGCRPVIIGELYGGGNLAGYSVYGYNSDKSLKESGTQIYADPQVNVKSFTSIGNIYGGGYGAGATMVANPTVNVNVSNGKFYDDNVSVVGENSETPNHYPIPSHAKGKIGAIYNVFGGGNAAKVIGNTRVNIGTVDKTGADIRGNVYGGGNNAEVKGNTEVQIGQ